MGSLDDPRLNEMHQQIQQAIYWSSQPNYQRICEILNGMSMEDMLDEIYRVKATGHLNRLAQFAVSATGVNNNRLRAAMGAEQDDPPRDLDTLIAQLPADQQRAITSVRAVTQPPPILNPLLFPRSYWQYRLLPTYIPPPSPANGGGARGDDDEAHLAADIATALTANAPRGVNPMTYTVTVVYRNFDLVQFGKDSDTELSLGHEPNVSVTISPDPNNSAAYQAVISLVNLHIKRNWGHIRPDIEISVGAGGGVQNPGAQPTGSLQAQVEVHVTSTISVVAGTGFGIGPGRRPDDPPDRGAFHFGNSNVDLSFTPFTIGILGHWDPPSR